MSRKERREQATAKRLEIMSMLMEKWQGCLNSGKKNKEALGEVNEYAQSLMDKNPQEKHMVIQAIIELENRMLKRLKEKEPSK